METNTETTEKTAETTEKAAETTEKVDNNSTKLDLELPTERKEPKFDIDPADFPGLEQEQAKTQSTPPPGGDNKETQQNGFDLQQPKNDSQDGSQGEKNLYNDNEFASLMADLFDSAQGNFSIALIVKKRRRRYFGDSEKFKKAEEYFYMSEAERERLDKDVKEEAKSLAERYRKYSLSLKDLTDKYMMNDNERRLFKRPLSRIAKENNVNMNPGVSVAIIALKILSDRFIDISMLD